MWSDDVEFRETLLLSLFGMIALLLAARFLDATVGAGANAPARAEGPARPSASLRRHAALPAHAECTDQRGIEKPLGSPRASSRACCRSRSCSISRGSDATYNELRYGGRAEAAGRMVHSRTTRNGALVSTFGVRRSGFRPPPARGGRLSSSRSGTLARLCPPSTPSIFVLEARLSPASSVLRDCLPT